MNMPDFYMDEATLAKTAKRIESCAIVMAAASQDAFNDGDAQLTEHFGDGRDELCVVLRTIGRSDMADEVMRYAVSLAKEG